MKNIAFLILSFFYFSLGNSFSQTDATKKNVDTIVVSKDPRLDVLTQKQAVINRRSKLMTSNGLYKGYRLQVLNSNNRNQAFKLKYDLMQAYPDQKAYVSF